MHGRLVEQFKSNWIKSFATCAKIVQPHVNQHFKANQVKWTQKNAFDLWLWYDLLILTLGKQTHHFAVKCDTIRGNLSTKCNPPPKCSYRWNDKKFGCEVCYMTIYKSGHIDRNLINISVCVTNHNHITNYPLWCAF